MKFHHAPAPEFSPTDLQPAPEGSGEYSHATTLLAEATQRIREREREIVRYALAAVFPASLGGMAVGKLPTESESLGFLGIIIESLGTGPDALTPLSAASRVKIGQYLGSDPQLILGWETLLRELAGAARTELPLGDTLLLQRRVEQTLDILPRHAAALALAPRSAAITASVVDAMRRAQPCEAAPGAEGLDPWACLHTRLEGFLNGFGQWLRRGSEAEIHLNLCRYWGEQLAPSFELSLPEWAFLFAALENALAEPLGPLGHRALTPFFDTFERMTPLLAFAGTFHRKFPELEQIVGSQVGRLPFDWRDCTREFMGEILWADPTVGSALAGRLAWGDPALGDVAPAEFRRFARLLINASRSLGERHWLDSLERALEDVALSLEGAQQRVERRPAVAKAVKTTAANLREGREAFRHDGFFEEDLQLLFDGASACARVSREVQGARRRFRAWFAGVFFLRRNHDVWRNAATITGALRTTLRRVEAEAPGGGDTGDLTGELLAEVPALQGEAEWLRQACVALDAAGASAVPTSEGRASVELLRRLAVETFRAGSRRAPVAALQWLLSPAGPGVATPGQAFAGLADGIERLDGVLSGAVAGNAGFTAARRRLIEILPPAVVGHQVWEAATTVGLETSQRVYAELPAYLEKTGPEGVRACARDLTLTLRRAALALRPGIPDPEEFLGEWWTGLISAHLKNRPARLFEATRELLRGTLAETVSPLAAETVDGLVGPLYQAAAAGAPTPGAEETPEPRAPDTRLPALDLQTPLWEFLCGQPSYGVAADGEGLAVFFQAAVANAVADPGMARHRPALTRHVEALAGGLAAGATRFLCGAGLDSGTTGWWRKVVVSFGNGGAVLAELLYRLPRQLQRPLAETVASTLPLLAYLDEMAGFHARCVAGLALGLKGAALAERIAARLEGSWPARALDDLFHGLADAWSGLPAGAAALHSHRLVTLTGVVPRDFWGTAIEEIVFLLPGEPCAEAQAGFNELAGLPMDAILTSRAIHQKLAGESEPLFAPDPVIEAQWRELVALLPVLAGLESTAVARKHLGRLYLSLCESLPLLGEPEFGDQLPCLGEALRGWFPDLPLIPTVKAAEALGQTWNGWTALRRGISALETQAANLGTRLGCGAVPDPGRTTRFLLLAALSGLVKEDAGDATVCSYPSWAPASLVELLVALPGPDSVRWMAAAGNLLASHGPQLPAALPEVSAALDRLRENRVSMEALWWGDWTNRPRPVRRGLFGFGAAPEPSTEDQKLLPDPRELMRRVCLDGLGIVLTPGISDAPAWYAARVLPFTEGISLEIQTAHLESTAERADLEPAVNSLGLRAALSRLQEAIAGHTVVHRLQLQQQFITDKLAELLGRQLPTARKQPSPSTGNGLDVRAQLARACVLPLRAICHGKGSAGAATNWQAGWSSTRLATSWQCPLPTFQHAAGKVGGNLLGRETTVLEAMLR